MCLTSTEVDLDPHRTFCPAVGCETVCHVCYGDTADSINFPIVPVPVDCPTVGFSHLYIRHRLISGFLSETGFYKLILFK